MECQTWLAAKNNLRVCPGHRQQRRFCCLVKQMLRLRVIEQGNAIDHVGNVLKSASSQAQHGWRNRIDGPQHRSLVVAHSIVVSSDHQR